MKVEKISYHRNGVAGEGFYVVAFRDKAEGAMVGIVFDDPGHVAVFNREALGEGEIRFGINSYRGDHYEKDLRAAIETEEVSYSAFQ